MATGLDASAAQHVSRTLRTLELLAEGPKTQAEVARRLSMHRRTARRLLARLVSEGYAEGRPRGRYVAYAATSQLAVLGRQAADALDLVEIGRPHLEALGDLCPGARFIAVLEDGSVTLPLVQAADPGCPSAWVGPPSENAPLHATAAGKVFLSADPQLLERTLNQELLAFTGNTIVTSADLLLELAAVRAQGYAVEDGEHRPEARAVASGIVNHTGRLVAAIGAELGPEESGAVRGPSVLRQARAFSVELGGVAG